VNGGPSWDETPWRFEKHDQTDQTYRLICQGENGMSRTLKEYFPNIIEVLNVVAATEMVSDDIAETECWRAV
jgi:hypothetical protein